MLLVVSVCETGSGVHEAALHHVQFMQLVKQCRDRLGLEAAPCAPLGMYYWYTHKLSLARRAAPSSPSQRCVTNPGVMCVLSCLQALLASGTTVISVGHRPTLIRYHQQVLQLASNQGGVPGKWRVLPAEQLLATANELV